MTPIRLFSAGHPILGPFSPVSCCNLTGTPAVPLFQCHLVVHCKILTDLSYETEPARTGRDFKMDLGDDYTDYLGDDYTDYLLDKYGGGGSHLYRWI